jgi:hypothetical protein
VLATREEDGGLVPRAAFRVPFDGPRYVLQEAPVSPQHLLVAHDYKLYWSLDGGRTFHWPDRMQLARLQPEKSGLRRLWFSRFLDDEWPQVVIAHFPGKNLLDAVTTIRKLGLPVATMRTLCDAAPAVARIEIWQLGPGRCDLVATVEPGSPEAVRLEDDHRACRREPSDLPLRAEPGGCLVRSGTGWAPLDLRELARAAVRDLGVAP